MDNIFGSFCFTYISLSIDKFCYISCTKTFHIFNCEIKCIWNVFEAHDWFIIYILIIKSN